MRTEKAEIKLGAVSYDVAGDVIGGSRMLKKKFENVEKGPVLMGSWPRMSNLHFHSPSG